MKLLVCSDWHPDKSTAGVPRYDEVARAVDETVDAAIREDVDAYLFLGDLCDPDAGSVVLRCVALAVRAAMRLACAGIPSFWLAGNHDVVEDGSGTTSLEPLKALGLGPDVTVCDEPGVHEIETRSSPGYGPGREKLRLVALPFTATSRNYDAEEWLRGKGLDAPDVVVAGHLHVPGITPGEESTEMARGRPMMFPVEGTRRCALRLNGHIHKQQCFTPPGGAPIWIPGSPARFAFGHDEGNVPGYLLVNVP